MSNRYRSEAGRGKTVTERQRASVLLPREAGRAPRAHRLSCAGTSNGLAAQRARGNYSSHCQFGKNNINKTLNWP